MEHSSQLIEEATNESSDSEGNDSDPGKLVIDSDQPATPPSLHDDATVPEPDLPTDPLSIELESKSRDQGIDARRGYSPKRSIKISDFPELLRCLSNPRETSSSRHPIVNDGAKWAKATEETSNHGFGSGNKQSLSSHSKCSLALVPQAGVAEFRNICAERDVHLVLPGRSPLGGKYISTKSYSGLLVQVFFPEELLPTLPHDPSLWSKVHFEAVSHLGMLSDFKFVFKSSEKSVSMTIQCPDTVETISSLITESKPFVLFPTSLHQFNEECIRRTHLPLILFAKHTKANILLNVEITHFGLNFRKLFSYIHYSSGISISDRERSMIRRDLAVVLRDFGRNAKLAHGKEERLFYDSKGLITYYRQMLFRAVKMIKPISQTGDAVEMCVFPMDDSFKLDGDLGECPVKCSLCELRFERGSETYFLHLGRYHFNSYCEPRTCHQPRCGYHIVDSVDYFRHVYSHSNGTISLEAFGNDKFQEIEASTQPKGGVTLDCGNPCPICLKKIATDNELKIHFIIIHCLNEILPHIPQKQGPGDKLLCPRIGCLEIFPDVWQLAIHIGINHDLIRTWLEPIPRKDDAIRCPLKSCSDRSLSNDWTRARSHLSQHSMTFVIEQINKLQRALGKDVRQCPMAGCSTETVAIIEHFHLEHGASLCWLSSLPAKSFDDLDLRRHWQERLSPNSTIYVCPVCVHSLHSAKYFGHRTALLHHLLDAHYRDELEKICNELSNIVDSFLCNFCNTRPIRTSWLDHHALVHERVIGFIPPAVYGELGKDIELVAFNLELPPICSPSRSNPLEEIVADLHRRASKQTTPKLPDVTLPTNYPPTAQETLLKKKKRTKRTPKSGMEGREIISRTLPLSSIQNIQREPALGSLPEAVQSSAALALEELQRVGKLPRLMELPFPSLCSNNSSVDFVRSFGLTSPKPWLPVSLSAQRQPGPMLPTNGAPLSITPVSPCPSQVTIPLGSPLVPFTREYYQLMAIKAGYTRRHSLLVACLKCEAGFKDLKSLLDHIEESPSHHEDAAGVCCHCAMVFYFGPQGTTASFFKLHAFSKTHLYNKWVTSVKQRMRGATKCDLQLRAFSMSVLNRCDICLEEVSQLDTHLGSPSHVQNAHLVTTFEGYCNVKIICPVTCSIQDVNYFFSLVHLKIISISLSFQQAPLILSRIHDPINDRELQHCQEMCQYVQNLETRTKKFKFVCLVCLSLTQNAQSLLQHSQTNLHKRNHPDSKIHNLAPIFQCLLCQSQFKHITDFKLHLYTKMHLSKDSQDQHPATQNFVNPTLRVYDYCPLCQTEQVLQGHTLNPSHIEKEKHANDYLQWCYKWKNNPVTCSKEDLKIYREHWFRTASSDSKFDDALNVIKHIHEPILGHCVSELLSASNVLHWPKDDGAENASHGRCGTTGGLTEPKDQSTERINGADLQNRSYLSFHSGAMMPNHLLNPSYTTEERHANDYLQWCSMWHQNPQTCSKESLKIYKDNWFWNAPPHLNFVDAVNVIKRIHEPIMGQCVSKFLITSKEERVKNVSHAQNGTAGILAELRDLSTGKNNGADSYPNYRETIDSQRPKPVQLSVADEGGFFVPPDPLTIGRFASDKTHEREEALWRRALQENYYTKHNSCNSSFGSAQNYPLMMNPWLKLMEEGVNQPYSGYSSGMGVKGDSQPSTDPQKESSPKRPKNTNR